ncbi:hypothetical protein [Rubrivivax gelatinosus]|uniref:Uncharacterized protein n=1 Tax=Rubrivivax gelatinosus TaxID=28068 RepID=A0ABS1DMU5_RUBGE|nr:hypothetical protein [Rubrivivax gelatinosus]MBK1711276.1 hypothetical protein [Rubrivivax gelatinosus]
MSRRPQFRHTREELLHRMELRQARRRHLTPDQIKALALAHLTNVDAIARGRADAGVMWDLAEAALQWSLVADALRQQHPDNADLEEAAAGMRAHLETALGVVKRWSATGRIVFRGPELTQARQAIDWMDALAEAVDQGTAIACALECARMLEPLKRQHQAPAAQRPALAEAA